MKINFVCLGNICRSPMAEYVMKNLVQQAGLSEKISIESRGTFAQMNFQPFTAALAANSKNTAYPSTATAFQSVSLAQIIKISI